LKELEMNLLRNICVGAAFCAFLVSCSESPEKYNQRAFNLADSVASYSDLNFDLASSCQRSWRSIIFDHYYINPITQEQSYCGDFNEGIAKYKDAVSSLVPILDKKKKYIDSVYATLKDTPEKSQKIFDNIKELVSIYERSYDIATNPEGSLQNYTSNMNDLFEKYKEIKSKIKLDRK
jgi:uncharacterized phage infection (PIP) family protein YhgE